MVDKYTPTATGASASNITEQFVREAPDIEAYKMGLMNSAQALPTPTLPDYEVAGMTDAQLAAITSGQQGIGAYKPYMSSATSNVAAGASTLGEAADVLRGSDTRGQYDAAQAALNQSVNPMQNMAQGVGIMAGATQQFNPYSAQAYMNPYQQQVIDESLNQINRQSAIDRQGLQSQATRAGAFGGSREGVQRAELARGTDMARNQAIISALQQGYGSAQQQAQAAFEAQQQRQMQAGSGIANIYGQQAQLGQALGQGIGNLATGQFNIGSQMAQGLGSLGTQLGNMGVQQAALGQTEQQLGQNDVNFLYNLGAMQQKQSQAVLDATRATKMQNALKDQQRLAFLSDIYKGAPSSQMAVTQQATASPSPFQQIAGVGTGILGLAGAANSMNKSGLF